MRSRQERLTRNLRSPSQQCVSFRALEECDVGFTFVKEGVKIAAEAPPLKRRKLAGAEELRRWSVESASAGKEGLREVLTEFPVSLPWKTPLVFRISTNLLKYGRSIHRKNVVFSPEVFRLLLLHKSSAKDTGLRLSDIMSTRRGPVYIACKEVSGYDAQSKHLGERGCDHLFR